MTEIPTNVHAWDEIQALLPPLSLSERRALAESIEQEGVKHPILVLPDGRIIDGHHRWELSRGDAPVQVLDLPEERAFTLALALNMARRQLSNEQLDYLQKRLDRDKEAKKEAALQLVKAGMSHGETGALLGVDRSTVSKWARVTDPNSEAYQRDKWAAELGGLTEQHSTAGRIDILTNTHAIEVEPVENWKHGLGQAVAYARATRMKAGLALYGIEPTQSLYDAIVGTTNDLDVTLWTRFEPRREADRIPGRLLKQWRNGDVLTDTQRQILRDFGYDPDEHGLIGEISPIKVPVGRMSIPKQEHSTIVERRAAGEPVEQIAADYKVTPGRISQIANAVEERQERFERLKEPAPLGEHGRQYPVIYADPPWRYEHVVTDNRAIENQYPTMELRDICALPVQEVTGEHCVLFMWATSPKLAEAMTVIDAWGFNYRTCMVWVKDKIGMGYYARQRHELLLIATRGEPPTPEPANRPDSVIEAPRLAHSAKPPETYEILDRMYPGLPKLELFARRPEREGWEGWGFEYDAA
jgi:N6-adenosine-specific RNA methylase IME4